VVVDSEADMGAFASLQADSFEAAPRRHRYKSQTKW
jgi:hypothetical protein